MPLEAQLGALRAVANALDPLGLPYAFVGGAIVNLLLDDPDFAPARPTDDVDVILKLVAAERYSTFEERLRQLGFVNDTRPDAPRCRWIFGTLTVDLMPIDERQLGLNIAWFAEALSSATVQTFAHTPLRLISPPAFLATKYAAFADRGKGDFHGSHDLEDFITVIDGRANIVPEINGAPAALRDFLIQSVLELLAVDTFNEALSGYLPSDRASQQRLAGLREKLRGISMLAASGSAPSAQ